MPQNLANEKSVLVQVMHWCRQATSHYLSQCWPKSMTPCGVTMPQRVKIQWVLHADAYTRQWILFIIGSSNGLSPVRTKPLSEQILTYYNWIIRIKVSQVWSRCNTVRDDNLWTGVANCLCAQERVVLLFIRNSEIDRINSLPRQYTHHFTAYTI